MTEPTHNSPPSENAPSPVPPSNNELAMQRTEMAETRTDLAQQRTGMSTRRTQMAETRTDLAQERNVLMCGHLLGGPDLSTRSAIIARNAGLALFLVAANGAPGAIPTIVAYGVIGSVAALPYNIWVKRQMQQASDPEEDQPRA